METNSSPPKVVLDTVIPTSSKPRSRPPFSGALNGCYTVPQRQIVKTEEYTLTLPFSGLKKRGGLRFHRKLQRSNSN